MRIIQPESIKIHRRGTSVKFTAPYAHLWDFVPGVRFFKRARTGKNLLFSGIYSEEYVRNLLKSLPLKDKQFQYVDDPLMPTMWTYAFRWKGAKPERDIPEAFPGPKNTTPGMPKEFYLKTRKPVRQ